MSIKLMQGYYGIDKLHALQSKPTKHPYKYFYMTNSLLIDDLCCARGERELFRSLGANVSSGQCLHVTGANGSGKTSLLRILCGLNHPEAGNVYWNSNPIFGDLDYLDKSAYIGHKDGLKNELTTIENLRFYLRLNAPGDKEVEDQLDDCLARMQILDCADLLAQQLSFGQRRRLIFATLLLRQYQLWILDEPFTGVDKIGRKIIERLCTEHLDTGGAIILTHHQSLEHSDLYTYITELKLG